MDKIEDYLKARIRDLFDLALKADEAATKTGAPAPARLAQQSLDKAAQLEALVSEGRIDEAFKELRWGSR